MITLAHLSDLHFGTEVPAVVNALRQSLEQLAPDLIIISGDLTQRARRREFNAALAFVKTLDSDVLIVPGNHDIPLFNPLARAFWPFRRYRNAFGSTELTTLDFEQARIIGLNTVRRERHASGRVSSSQRARVAALAEEADPDALVVVVAHHPLSVTSLEEATDREPNDRATLDAWYHAGVGLILSGHVHRPFFMEVGQSMADAHSAHSLWLLNAGTACSKRLRHDYPNSFNSLVIDEDGDGTRVLVQRHDFEVAESCFRPRSSESVPFPRTS